MSSYPPSPQQAAILNWVDTGRGSAIVQARAGSGKTSLIKMVWPRLSESCHVQSFAFNSSIAKELNAALAEARIAHGREFRSFRASTFHSVGFAAVCRKLGKTPREVQTDPNKLRTLCRNWLGDAELEMYGPFIAKLVGLARGQGMGCLVADTPAAWAELIAHHDLYLDDTDASEEQAIELARQLLRRSNEVAREGVIDYDDQLYLPLLWRLRLWQNDWVIVDEAQDTNPVRRALAKLALKPGGRLIAVGDDRQAIYGFTGASHDALDLIKNEFNAVVFPLSVCYRCAEAIVEDAAQLVPDLEAAPGAAAGMVTKLPLFVPDRFKDDPQYTAAIRHLTATDAILCRNVAPLVSVAYELIARGVACGVLGREIGTGLVELVKKQKARGIDALFQKLDEYLEREIAKFTAKGQEGKAASLSDRVDCLRVIAGTLDESDRTVPALIRKIEDLFADKANVLTLSSIHKAKGREWDTVAILRPDLMPSKWARQAWQAHQEENLDYVARTRARKHLIRLTDTFGA